MTTFDYSQEVVTEELLSTAKVLEQFSFTSNQYQKILELIQEINTVLSE